VGGVLDEAERWTSHGSVLATFDAPLGVPESYLTAAASVSSWRAPTTFLEFLGRAHSVPHFFDGTSIATNWKVERPFFSVPNAGEGGLHSYRDAAARHGVNLYRRIDQTTRAKTLFAKSGIPGSVGSATCALWQELAPRLVATRTFKVWPFEGDLQVLLQSTPVVMGEIYPRAAYATALLEFPAATRPPLSVAKTDVSVRREAIAALSATTWVRSFGVRIENLAEAEANEDDFDACVTAAALLRCVLEGSPLCPAHLESALSEGGMLGTGSVDLRLPQQTFCGLARVPEVVGLVPSAARRLERTRHRAEPVVNVQNGSRIFRCPIVGCDKVYRGSRGGWDGHVGSLRLHPHWHPELTSAADRKRQYEIEFPGFFR